MIMYKILYNIITIFLFVTKTMQKLFLKLFFNSANYFSFTYGHFMDILYI